MPGKSYYSILNLKEGASKAEIKKSYRRLVKKYHPDVSKDPNCHEKYLEINEAYEALLEPKPKTKRKTSTTKAQKWENYKEESRKKTAQRDAQKAQEIKRFYQSLRTGWRRGWIRINVMFSIIICAFIVADQESHLTQRKIKITSFQNLSQSNEITTLEGSFTLHNIHSILRSKTYVVLFESNYLKQAVYVAYKHDGKYMHHKVLFGPRGPSFYWGFPAVFVVSILPLIFYLFFRKNNGWFVFFHYTTLIVTTPWLIYFIVEHPEMIDVLKF